MKPIAKFLFVIMAISLLPSVAFAADEPKADDRAVVVAGNARFTVLTPQLIRMEWSEDGVFEDRATLTFVNRKTDVPQFKCSNGKNKLVIRTDKLTLTYIKGAKFSANNLSAEFLLNGQKVVWHYGDVDTQNLMGTTRTLDKCDGWNLNPNDPMEPGIISRSGWSVVDDSTRHLFVDTQNHWQKWVECRTEVDRQDLYLFAYGHDYMQAVKDYIALAGRIPLPPKYAFGYWWSRYWQIITKHMLLLHIVRLATLWIVVVHWTTHCNAGVICLTRSIIYIRRKGIAQTNSISHIEEMVRELPDTTLNIAILGTVSLEYRGKDTIL